MASRAPKPDDRIPLERCRALLGEEGQDLGDGVLRELRDALYAVAETLPAVGQGASPTSLMLTSAEQVAPALNWEAVEERAAIMEFEGEVARDVAERVAICDHLAKEQGNE
jgi:hypothetical protein